MNISLDSPLELKLKEWAVSRGAEFPNRDGRYFERYVSIKSDLARRYYSVAGVGLAQEGERYTRHDIGHVDDVIHTAGRLLGFESDAPSPAFEKLHPYEVFALLLAILLHDAGNAIARVGHAKLPKAILEELGPIVDLQQLEKRLIALIAQAHGGATSSGNKDTIRELIDPAVPNIGQIELHARRLAAIVRFADELSENPRRADDIALIDDARIPSQSVIHNLYCKVINIRADYLGHTISIDFDVERELLDREFVLKEDSLDTRILLIDYITRRLEKCEQERRYCHRFLAGFVSYDRIRVKLQVCDGGEIVDVIAFELEDRGYPAVSPSVKEIAPNFDGAKLRIKHCSSVTGGSIA